MGRIRLRQLLGPIVALLLLFLGVLSFVLLLKMGLNRSLAKLERFSAGEEHQLQLEVGTYLLLQEGATLDSFLAYQLRDGETSELIPLKQPLFRNAYSFEGRRGKALYEFTITTPGTYTLEQTSFIGGSWVLAVGHRFYRRMVLAMLFGFTFLFISFILGGLLLFQQMGQRVYRYLDSQ